MSDRPDDLKAFLDTVLQSQDSKDEQWRNMGRWFGLFFLGALAAGVESEHALDLTASYQLALLQQRQQSQ